MQILLTLDFDESQVGPHLSLMSTGRDCSSSPRKMQHILNH